MTQPWRSSVSDFPAVRPLLFLLALGVFAACTSSSTKSTSSTNEVVDETASFAAAFSQRLAVEGLAAKDVCPSGDPVAERVLADYGALFVTTEEVEVMPRCVFRSAQEVEMFQQRVTTESSAMEGTEVTLQVQALAALKAAREQAVGSGLTITPQGPFPAARDFDATVDLWTSRVEPALDHWRQEGRLSAAEIARIENADPIDQVAPVLSFERRGIFFSTEFDRSILTSVAAPGTSQHLSLLAFDVVEHADQRVREVLAEHGWFQTVEEDLPHFTYLGREEGDLPDLGLEEVTSEGRTYWVPAI